MQTKMGIPINRRGMFRITRSIDTCATQEQLEICLNWIKKIFDTETAEYGWMYAIYLNKKAKFVELENKTFKKPLEIPCSWH